MVRVSSPAKLRPWSELIAQNGDGGGSWVGDKPKKGQNEKFTNFALFFVNSGMLNFFLRKEARFTLNFCSGMPLRKVHELTFLWFGLPGPLLIKVPDLAWISEKAPGCAWFCLKALGLSAWKDQNLPEQKETWFCLMRAKPKNQEAAFLCALKGTELRWQREPKTQILAETTDFRIFTLFLEIPVWRAQETADFRRKPKIFAEDHRKPQIGLRHLRSVTFNSALPFVLND